MSNLTVINMGDLRFPSLTLYFPPDKSKETVQ